MNKTAVTKKDAQIPEHLKQYVGQATGVEGLDKDDIATPRLILLQALSPQLEEDDSLRGGEFFHSGAGVGLGSEIDIIPLHLTRSYTLWRPRPEGGILARSRDGVHWDRHGVWSDIKLKNGKTVTWEINTTNVKASGLADWGSSDTSNPDSQPAATLTYNLAVLLPDHQHLGPVVLSMQRSQIKVARKLNGRLKLSPVPLFGLQISLSVFKDSGPEGAFYNLRFGKFVLQPDPVLTEQAKGLFEMFAETGIAVKDDDEPDEAIPAIDDDIPF